MKNTLLMPFIDASESFTNGFECGQLWQRIAEGEQFTQQLIHLINQQQIKMICELFGVEAIVEAIDDTWAYLTIKTVLNEA